MAIGTKHAMVIPWLLTTALSSALLRLDLTLLRGRISGCSSISMFLLSLCVTNVCALSQQPDISCKWHLLLFSIHGPTHTRFVPNLAVSCRSYRNSHSWRHPFNVGQFQRLLGTLLSFQTVVKIGMAGWRYVSVMFWVVFSQLWIIVKQCNLMNHTQKGLSKCCFTQGTHWSFQKGAQAVSMVHQ